MEDYELGGLLGRGGMGEVHIARHRSGRLVAIKKVRKTLSLDPALCERLSLEANILRRIDHPNVVSVLDG
ncbi:MAG TPA: serine/threonine protein kinase, partial [Kofleriaceae bacterium]